MNKPIAFVKKYLGEMFTIAGVVIFVYNVFGFSYETSTGSYLLPKLGKEMIQGVAYYYTSNTQMLIAVGAALIILGLIIMKHEK